VEIKQSTAFKVPVRLVLSSTGAEAVGLTYSNVTVYLQAQGGTSTAKTLTGTSDFVEVDPGNFPGVYDLQLASGNTATVGFLKYAVSSPGCRPYFGLVEIVANIEADTYARLGAPVLATISADIASIPPAVWDAVLAGHTTDGTSGRIVQDALRILKNRTRIDTITNQLIVYGDDETTPIFTYALKDNAGVANAKKAYEKAPV
jgi:hypothetical protein